MWGNGNWGSSREGCNLAIDTYFSKDHVVEIDLEASRRVFRVPKPTADTKPQAYAPRFLCLGPYHHLRPDYTSQLTKISRVRDFLGPKLEVFQHIVGALVKREPTVRACYAQYLDFDMKTLAGIIAVDALYLLRFLVGCVDADEMTENVAADILMEENQIPVVLFQVILEVLLQLQSHEKIGSAEHVLFTDFGSFCQAYSPMELDKSLWELTAGGEQFHLLDRMYRSIVSGVCRDRFTARKIGDQLNGGAAAAVSEELPSIPTASELSESAGLKFKQTLHGIRDVVYNADENSLQLQTIKIDGNSETVLRNLLAYEEAVGNTPELGEYLSLMCGLVRTDKDVVVLKKAEIIRGEASDDGVVGVFDEIGRLMGDSRKKLSKVIVEDVGKTYDEVWSVKAVRLAKKSMNLAWRFLILVTAVLVVAVLVMQAFCSVFSCGRSGVAVPGLGYQ